MAKPAWTVFLDLQCPYSKVAFDNLPGIRARLEDKYEITTHITSLAFHPQAFTAQCAAMAVAGAKGPEAKEKYVSACFAKQESYMNAAIGDARPSEVKAVFAGIAEEAGLLDGTFTKDEFLAKMADWEGAVKPAYAEHKVALQHGVYGTPKHVIDGKLIEGTESAWGADEWEAKLAELKG